MEVNINKLLDEKPWPYNSDILILECRFPSDNFSTNKDVESLYDETISVMLIITVLTPKDLAWFFAKSTDSVSLKGIIKPVTFSEPNAETAKDRVTAESRPPDKPNTTPSDSASATLD